MATSAVTLKQADIDLLVAVCDQFNEVDAKKLGVKLGCSTTAAYKRWKRFKERTFGEKKEGEQGENSNEGEGEVKTPPSKRGKKGDAAGVGGKKGNAKRGHGDGDADGETPKKAKTKKTPRGKKGSQANNGDDKGESEQLVNGEKGDSFVQNDDRYDAGLQQELYAAAEQQMKV